MLICQREKELKKQPLGPLLVVSDQEAQRRQEFKNCSPAKQPSGQQYTMCQQVWSSALGSPLTASPFGVHLLPQLMDYQNSVSGQSLSLLVAGVLPCWSENQLHQNHREIK